MKACFLIPNYNHGPSLPALLKKLTAYQLDCIIVDDGSNTATRHILKQLQLDYSQLIVLNLNYNQGKGAALMTGLRYAYRQGYSHALQIDADGQHDTQDIAEFLRVGEQHPEALITGLPQYDDSAPAARVYGRRFTNFWVMLETWSWQIKDAMCGFRLYPVAACWQLLQHHRLNARMGFDIDIIVRLYWQGVEVINIPTKVIYPPGGLSHFKLWQSNVQVSWVHTRLIFGMLTRLPALWHRRRSSQVVKPKHWSQIKELGSVWGMRFLLRTYKLCGKRVMLAMLYGVIAYFYVTAKGARQASQRYLQQLTHYDPYLNHEALSSFKHFTQFAKAAVDKFAVWHGDITVQDVDFPDVEQLRQAVTSGRGGVIFTAHLGNIEIARALASHIPGLKINAIVFNQHAKKFNQLLSELAPEQAMNLIHANDLNSILAMQLKQKIEAGEFMVIVADRTSTTKPERMLTTDFLGKTAYFPQGPFVLAGLLGCPLYFMLCLQQATRGYQVIFEPFADDLNIARKQRQQALQTAVTRYAQRLEHYCSLYPLQWYNFFDFWHAPLQPPTHEE